MDLTVLATAHAKSYASVFQPRIGSENTQRLASAIYNHYKPGGFISFAFGNASTMTDRQSVEPQLKVYLDKWITYGLGLDIRMDDLKTEIVCDNGEHGGGSVLCWITWSIHPTDEDGKKGREEHVRKEADGSVKVTGWSWQNLYCYRLPPGMQREEGYGWWEWVVSDNEVSRLMEECGPEFMEG